MAVDVDGVEVDEAADVFGVAVLLPLLLRVTNGFGLVGFLEVIALETILFVDETERHFILGSLFVQEWSSLWEFPKRNITLAFVYEFCYIVMPSANFRNTGLLNNCCGWRSAEY